MEFKNSFDNAGVRINALRLFQQKTSQYCQVSIDSNRNLFITELTTNCEGINHPAQNKFYITASHVSDNSDLSKCTSMIATMLLVFPEHENDTTTCFAQVFLYHNLQGGKFDEEVLKGMLTHAETFAKSQKIDRLVAICFQNKNKEQIMDFEAIKTMLEKTGYESADAEFKKSYEADPNEYMFLSKQLQKDKTAKKYSSDEQSL